MVVVLALSFVVMIAVLAVAVALTRLAVHDVPDGEVQALVVFGEIQGVLLPGRNYIPPLFSETYPIDRDEMRVEHEDEELTVPEDCVERIERWEEQKSKKAGRQ